MKKLWVFKPRKDEWAGTHKVHGIFIAYGKDIKKNYKINEVKIYDIAPTILHIFNLPIPNDIDGKVLIEIFEPESEIARRKPKIRRTKLLYKGRVKSKDKKN